MRGKGHIGAATFIKADPVFPLTDVHGTMLPIPKFPFLDDSVATVVQRCCRDHSSDLADQVELLS
jgi:hypothetical protein